MLDYLKIKKNNNRSKQCRALIFVVFIELTDNVEKSRYAVLKLRCLGWIYVFIEFIRIFWVFFLQFFSRFSSMLRKWLRKLKNESNVLFIYDFYRKVSSNVKIATVKIIKV